MRDIGIREARNSCDVSARVKLRAIPAKVLHDVATVAEEKHDVLKIACVREPQGVAEFVQAGQINDGVSEQIVCPCFSRDIRAERLHIRAYENGGTALPVHQKRLRLAIFAAARFGPVKPNERGGFAGRFEAQAFPRVA